MFCMCHIAAFVIESYSSRRFVYIYVICWYLCSWVVPQRGFVLVDSCQHNYVSFNILHDSNLENTQQPAGKRKLAALQYARKWHLDNRELQKPYIHTYRHTVHTHIQYIHTYIDTQNIHTDITLEMQQYINNIAHIVLRL